jgi:hypothetical protein
MYTIGSHLDCIMKQYFERDRAGLGTGNPLSTLSAEAPLILDTLVQHIGQKQTIEFHDQGQCQ